MLAPVLDEIARDLQGQAVVGKVNVDEQGALASRFNIQSIPTLLYFSGGELRDGVARSRDDDGNRVRGILGRQNRERPPRYDQVHLEASQVSR